MLKSHQACVRGICALLLTITCSLAIGQRGKLKRHYPLVGAGIKVGTSTDADVQRLYGKGYFAEDEGHLGGRYFVDSGHRVTLHIEMGVDHVVEEVEYQRGIHLPLPPTPKIWRQATSPHLTPDKTTQRGIKLGMQARAVMHLYGKPAKNGLRNGTGVIEYDADYKTMPHVLDYEAKFRFHRDRLISVSLYNGD